MQPLRWWINSTLETSLNCLICFPSCAYSFELQSLVDASDLVEWALQTTWQSMARFCALDDVTTETFGSLPYSYTPSHTCQTSFIRCGLRVVSNAPVNLLGDVNFNCSWGIVSTCCRACHELGGAWIVVMSGTSGFVSSTWSTPILGVQHGSLPPLL